MNQVIDLTGCVFGRLTVIERGETVKNRATWRCICQCGSKAIVTGKSLRKGTTKSCGCLHHDNKPLLKHGYTQNRERPPEFSVWLGIRVRCLNPQSNSYKNYGGRGITIADVWINDFAAFREYVGERPSDQHSLDRIDNSKGYEPGNVRWVTRAEQNRNKRSNRIITVAGKTQCLTDWAKELGVDESFIRARLNRGMSPLDAITKPRIPIEECNAKLISFNDKNMSIAAWARETGIPATALYRRISVLGWSVEKALTTPKRGSR